MAEFQPTDDMDTVVWFEQGGTPFGRGKGWYWGHEWYHQGPCEHTGGTHGPFSSRFEALFDASGAFDASKDA